MDYIEISGKTVDDAITEACQTLEVTSDRLDYEIVDKGSSGFLGFGNKPAVIKARIKSDDNTESEAEVKKSDDKKEKKEKVASKKEANVKNEAFEESEDAPEKSGVLNDPKEFLDKVFEAMDLKVDIKVEQTGEHSTISLAEAAAASSASAMRPAVPLKRPEKARKEKHEHPWYKDVPVWFWTLFAAGYILAIIMGCFFFVSVLFQMK